ncbi:MAG TPA: hypothetical protein VGL66_17520 [Caulobacteraceae bacterium]|jgi:hypothetical protein
MSEPPVQIDADTVTAAPKPTGHRWIDLLLAGSAILISGVSLFIAAQNANMQQRMVAATSWPFLQFRTANNGDQGKPMIAMKVVNVGQGPALLKHVTVTYDGKPVRGAYDLMQACCGWAPKTDAELKMFKVGTAPLGGVVIQPHEEYLFYEFENTGPAADAVWRKMDQARFKLKFDACYCSVLGECWRSDLRSLEPTPVKVCPKDRGYGE